MGLACRESEGNGLSWEMTGDSRSPSDEANVMTNSHYTARLATATTLGLRCVHYFFAPCVCTHISHTYTLSHMHTYTLNTHKLTCTHNAHKHMHTHVHTRHMQIQHIHSTLTQESDIVNRSGTSVIPNSPRSLTSDLGSL